MNTALSTSYSDAAFFQNRKAMLVYPAIVLPFIIILFAMFGGGKGERYLAQDAADAKAGAGGFNAQVPTAKNGSINGRDVETPGYGRGKIGQVLSSFTHTRKDSSSMGLKAIPVTTALNTSPTTHASSLASSPSQPVASGAVSTPPQTATRSYRKAGKAKTSQTGGYYYNAPGSSPTASPTDQQLAAQLRTYESTRQPATQTVPVNVNQPTGNAIASAGVGEDARPASVQLSDNLTATRLTEPTSPADAFNTAPTGGSRRIAERAVLSGSNSYGNKKTVAWMIPVVVHEDQTFKSGNTVKLRLIREITADGITIPANTILHAICQTGDDRLRMSVQSVRLGDQLIPLDLEVYDVDGLAGVNMPGLSNQVGGQMRSSAIQGLQIPGMGGLVNTITNQARMSASNATRQATVRLKAGYNLYLKA